MTDLAFIETFARSLHARADGLRERAIVADQERGGSVPDEVVDRWAGSFATAYQATRAIALALEDTLASRQGSGR